MNNNYTYEQLFDRNNGVFNEEEINKIKSLKLALWGQAARWSSCLYFSEIGGRRNNT